MAFRNISTNALCKFNSQVSSDFIVDYEKSVLKKSSDNHKRVRNKAIVPSSFRCERVQWFRLRGVETDNTEELMKPTDIFITNMGDSIHYNIQSVLSFMESFENVSVADYLKKFPIHYKYELEISDNQMETKIKLLDDKYPVQMSCDGILKYDNRYYILEIKTSEYASWNGLTYPKPEHIEQVKMYSTFLNIDNILMFYVERQYGGVKCFELNIKESDKQYVFDKIDRIMKCVENNLCPEPLNKMDSWCVSSRCDYFKTCKLYGR